jgi:hypothetical protein
LVGPDLVTDPHRRIVGIVVEKKVVAGRRADAGGQNSSGNQHPLTDRQHPVGGSAMQVSSAFEEVRW